MITHSTAARNAAADAVVDLIDGGTGTQKLRLKTSGAATLVDLVLSATAFGNGGATVAGRADAAAITTGTATGTGTAALFDFLNKSGTVVFSGTVTQQYAIATSALTAANGNVLTFAATTGVAVGMNVSGTGIVAGTTVVAVTGTTVTLSQTSTAGVSSGATITFGGDITVDNVSINSGQTVAVSSYQYTGLAA